MKSEIVKNLNNGDFHIEQGEDKSMILLDPKGDIYLRVKDEAHFKIAIVNKSENKTLIRGSVGRDSHLEVYYADFARSNNIVHTDIDLNGDNASVDWHLASLSRDKTNKTYEISASHTAIGTRSQIDNYGVCKEGAKLNFSGIVQIKHGAHKSIAHQNAKIIIFDDQTDAIAKPILKIDDNDIEASHSSTVGKISDDEIFYLTSRGIATEKAKELITFGYLKPIISAFENDEIAAQLTSEVEGGF